MFAPVNAAHFTLLIPTVCNDFRVLAFDGAETIRCFNIGESA
jgi:type VI secretion system secreted protein VgrG